jgi:hypothetical protein
MKNIIFAILLIAFCVTKLYDLNARLWIGLGLCAYFTIWFFGMLVETGGKRNHVSKKEFINDLKK